MRDYNGYLESRGKILDKKPESRYSWIGFALANYYVGSYNICFDIINKYFEIIQDSDSVEKYEKSELYLLQNRCIELLLNYNECIKHLNKNLKNIVDINYYNIKIAYFLLLNNNYNESLKYYNILITQQSENYMLHVGLHLNLLKLNNTLLNYELYNKCNKCELPLYYYKLTNNQIITIINYYNNELLPKIKKSNVISKIILALASQLQPETVETDATVTETAVSKTIALNESNEFNNDNIYLKFHKLFIEILEKYLIKYLSLGIPALYQDIDSIIRIADIHNPNQLNYVLNINEFNKHLLTKLILLLLNKYIYNLETFGTFQNTSETQTTIIIESPSSLLWTYFLKSHLLEKCGNNNESLIIIEKSLLHTPTALDMYIQKSLILSNLGQYLYASQIINNCRLLDLQDRYLNNITTKYLLKANQITLAKQTINLFIKHEEGIGSSNEPDVKLNYLQTNWYELLLAKIYYNNNTYNLSIKKFYDIKKHFHDYYEDMFDFHGYVIRKVCNIHSSIQLFIHCYD